MPGVTHVVLLEGINDIARSILPGEDAIKAADLIAGYRRVIALAHAHNLKIIGGTMTPGGGSRHITPALEAVRLETNRWIRNSGEFDAVIDFDAALGNGATPAALKPEYDSGDHLHPGDAGYAAMANAVVLNLFTPRRTIAQGITSMTFINATDVRWAGTNLERAADHNQRITLHAIRVHEDITRVELAAITGLTAPAISNITRRLLNEGLIVESGQRRGGRGQPATRLRVQANARHAIGLNIDRDHITIVVVDFNGKILARATRNVDYAPPRAGARLLFSDDLEIADRGDGRSIDPDRYRRCRPG